MFFPFKPLKGNFLKCTPSSRCHKATVFKIDASVNIQLGPMALGTARGEALCQAAIWQSLERTVYPSEAERFFHNIYVRKNARWGSLAPAYDDPTLLPPGVILLQPGPEL